MRHDYFVIRVERLERRADWSGLPGLESYAATFTAILASGKDKDGLHTDLKVAWPPLREALVTSPHLTRRDAEEIAKDVGGDLLNRVEAIVSEIRSRRARSATDRSSGSIGGRLRALACASPPTIRPQSRFWRGEPRRVL